MVNPFPHPRRPQSRWSDLPTELHLQISSYVRFNGIQKPIPASICSVNQIDASYLANALNTGFQSLGRKYYREIRELTQEETKTSGWTLVTVHWDCVDQVFPLLQMVKTACENDIRWADTYQDLPGQTMLDKSMSSPIDRYLEHEMPGTRQKYYTTISTIERNALEDFLEKVLHDNRILHMNPSTPWHVLGDDTDSSPFTIRILIPFREEYVPAPGSELGDALGASYNDKESSDRWVWPDPRLIQVQDGTHGT